MYNLTRTRKLELIGAIDHELEEVLRRLRSGAWFYGAEPTIPGEHEWVMLLLKDIRSSINEVFDDEVYLDD